MTRHVQPGSNLPKLRYWCSEEIKIDQGMTLQIANKDIEFRDS